MTTSPRSPSVDSDQSSSSNIGPSCNSLSLGQHSTSALILVHDDTDNETRFSFSDGEDGSEETHVEDSASVPEFVLPPSVVFGYFLSPCLKLGAMLALSSQASLKYSIPALLIFSFLSAFSRQIWFLLARYTRKNDVGDIVLEAFARDRGREKTRSFLKSVTSLGSGTVRLLLATIYLKGATRSLEALLPSTILYIPSWIFLSIIFLVFITPLSLVRTLASKRLIYSTGMSNGLFVAWLCAIIYAHGRGTLDTDTVMIARGRLLQDITSVAFTFASLSTLQLYTSMIGSRASTDQKEKRYLSISSVSISAALVGTVMVLPLLFPEVKSHGHNRPMEDPSALQGLIATLTALILILAVPPLISTCPLIPLPLPSSVRRIARPRTFSTSVLLIALFLLYLLPPSVERILEDMTVLLVLLSSYFLPALLHIILHNMRRPLTILVQPMRRTPSEHSDGSAGSTHDPETEELLLRKERALQRRRLGRRILWDLGVWFLLVPVGGGGIVWSVGRIIGNW